MTRIIALVSIAIGFGLWLPIAVADTPCEDCGPGEHWIHSPPCPAGQDSMTSEAVVGIDMNGDCVADISLRLGGPTTVSRSAPIDDSVQFPGLRPVDSHLDVIDTEIVSLSLTGGGVTLTAGVGLGTNPLGNSFGAVAEKPSNPALADSFFDVFFEVALGGGMFAYNHTALPLQAVIDCVPPQATYIHPTGCLPLFTLPTGGGQIPGMNLVSARHITFPPAVGACCFKWGSCEELTGEQCVGKNGRYLGDGASCSGQDNNGNGRDDACGTTPSDIPAVSNWGFLVMGVLVLTAATLAIRGRRAKLNAA